MVKCAAQLAAQAQQRKILVARYWRLDETYIKDKGKWTYLYRAVDSEVDQEMIRGIISPRNGQTIDFMLSETRDEAAATTFFTRMIRNNGWPDKVVIDKSGANNAGLENVNAILLMLGWCWLIDVLQVKYLNNIIEQDHRFIKRITRPMKGFKSFNSAAATLAGIEAAHMLRKGQIHVNGRNAFEQFADLAA